MKTVPLTELDPVDLETGLLNVIIETPRDSRNKYKYVPEQNLFRLNKVLPAGAMFPYDFGMIPSTRGEDGDPLDVLVLMDEPVYPGVLVPARLVGAIQAEQTEKDGTERNDRLIAVSATGLIYQKVQELTDLYAELISQIEYFFISYNRMEEKEFRPIGRLDATRAGGLLEEGRKRYNRKGKP